MTFRIIIADDQKIMRHGLRSLLSNGAAVEVVGEAETGHEAVRLALKLEPDVVIMDISMPDLNGIEATREIRSRAPNVKVVALSMYNHNKLVLRMLKAGASAYLLKDCAFEELNRAIEAVMDNRTYLSPGVSDILVESFIRKGATGEPETGPELTPREREVLQLIAEGKTTKQAASKLNLSVKTVETHRQHIMDKLNIHTVAELTKYAIREGLTSLES